MRPALFLLTLALAPLALAGCPKREPPPPPEPSPPRRDGPKVTGPVAFLELDGGRALVRDGKIERVAGLDADVLVPGKAHAVWLFDHGRVRRLSGGVADKLGGLRDRLGFVHRQADGRMLLTNAETDEVQAGNVIELWRTTDGEADKFALPVPLPKVKDARIAGDDKYVLGENVLLVSQAKQPWRTVPLPEPSGFPRRSLVVAKDGAVLVATMTTVLRLRTTDGDGPPFEVLHRATAKLVQSPQGEVYAQGPLRVFRYREGELKPLEALGERADHVGVGPDGTIAAQQEGGRSMVVMTPDEKVRRIPAEGQLRFPLAFEDVVVGEGGQIWAISPHGLVVAHAGRVHYFGRNVVPALDADVKAIAVDGVVKLPDYGPPRPIRIEGQIIRDGGPVKHTTVQACTVAVTTLNDGSPCNTKDGRFHAAETTSDHEGRFVFENLPPGPWQLAFAYQGGWKVRLRRPCGDTKPGETCQAGDIGAR